MSKNGYILALTEAERSAASLSLLRGLVIQIINGDCVHSNKIVNTVLYMQNGNVYASSLMSIAILPYFPICIYIDNMFKNKY